MSKKESTSKVILSLEDYRVLDAYRQMFEKNSFTIFTENDLCFSVTKDEVVSKMEQTLIRFGEQLFYLKEINKVLEKENTQLKLPSSFLSKLFKKKSSSNKPKFYF